MKNIVIIALLTLIFVLVGNYLRKEKRKGIKCIGCPYAKNCQKHKNGC